MRCDDYLVKDEQDDRDADDLAITKIYFQLPELIQY